MNWLYPRPGESSRQKRERCEHNFKVWKEIGPGIVKLLDRIEALEEKRNE